MKVLISSSQIESKTAEFLLICGFFLLFLITLYTAAFFRALASAYDATPHTSVTLARASVL